MADSIIDNPDMFKQALLNAANNDPEEFKKIAAAGTTEFTRRRMREDAFSPAILPYEKIEDNQLDRSIDTEEPFRIYEMEPEQALPRTISFQDTGESQTFAGDKYMLVFYKNTTPEWTKNINFLRTYRNDIREILTDNMQRDLSRLKDVKWMKETHAIVGNIPGAASPLTGEQQFLKFPGRLDRNNWVSAMQPLPSRSLMNGVFLCNRRTFSEFMRLGRDEIGGDFSQELFKKGLQAFEKTEVSGIPFVVTQKSDIVPNGIIYEYTKPNYLGHAGVLKAPTMYVKMDKDMITMSCDEIIGVTIANTYGVQAVEFADIAGPTGGDGRILAK